MKAAFVKRLGGLRPADEIAQEVFDKIAQGAEVLVEIKQARSIRHHKLAFALFRLLFDNSDRWTSVDHVRTWLLCETGYCDNWPIIIDGEKVGEYRHALSMSFANMSQEKFSEFWGKALDLVNREFDKDMVDAVYRLVGMDYSEVAA